MTGFTRVSQKSKGTFIKKHIYCKYTETKLISLFNVIPLDFIAPVPVFSKFLIPSEKSFLIASLTNFASRQFLERVVTADETWVHHYEPESEAQEYGLETPDITHG
jgi:hypothetical protein